MVKETPSLGRMLAMLVFTMSCFGILMFLWIAFGGSVPLRPEGYRFKVAFPEAATLAQEADVRLAGVNVGKVKTKELDKGGAKTIVEIELKEPYAPIGKDTKVILRQKTLLGETYVELSQGRRGGEKLQDGDTLSAASVEPTVELDEIFNAFDEETRDAFAEWMKELAASVKHGRSKDLNDAFGNLEGFAVDGAKLLETLDTQETALRQTIKNTGVVFGAINEREGALQQLIVNGNNTFEALASRDDALAETIRVFPTFLDESKATLARLETFAVDTRPLVNKLKPAADDLGPTVRDLGDLSPDLVGLFRDLDPLIKAGRRGVPDLERILRGAEPLLGGLNTFLDELNPILSSANFYQARIAGFITNAAADLTGPAQGSERYQTNMGMIEPRSLFSFNQGSRPSWDRGTAYMQPNGLNRVLANGGYDSFDCKHNVPSNTHHPLDLGGGRGDPVTGVQKDPFDNVDGPPVIGVGDKRPPCIEAPKSLFDGKLFQLLQRGKAPIRRAPQGIEDGN